MQDEDIVRTLMKVRGDFRECVANILERNGVAVYDDRTSDSKLEKYFGAEGIKKVEQKSLEDL